MLNIDSQRLLQDLQNLAQIGKTDAGGVSRLALSKPDLAGRNWFKDRIAESGLEPLEDTAGNISTILRSSSPGAKTILLGSHLDTVPNGGRHDGSLGVLSALEVLRTLQDAGLNLPFHIEAVSFTDEEGRHIGLLGSRALIGDLTPEDFNNPRGGGELWESGLNNIGLTEQGLLNAGRDTSTISAYLEIHIEQGKRLEETKIDVGIVNAIVGIRSYWINFHGQASHAGTTPMNERKDALLGAAAFIAQAREMIMTEFDPGVINFGQAEILPGAFNIIPEDVDLALEFRHGSEDQLDKMEERLLALAHQIAAENNLEVRPKNISPISAAPMDQHLINLIEQAAKTLNLSSVQLLSFAGHDAQVISLKIPSAMIFVPSVDGISHNPNELTLDHDIVNGANTMLHTVLGLIQVHQDP